MKKILFILLFIILLGTGFFFYNSSKKTSPENTTEEKTFTQRLFDIFPGGESGENTEAPEETLEEIEEEPEIVLNETEKEGVLPKLRQLYDKPVSGSIILEKTENVTVEGKQTTKKTYVVRFMDKATGHIYDIAHDSKNILKRSNTTIPKMHDSYFGADGNIVVSRFLGIDNETIKTYAITLKNQTFGASSTPEERLLKSAETNFLPTNMREIAISPNKTKIAYLLYNETGGEVIVSNLNGSGATKIYTSPLREWLLSWKDNSNLLISTKPSGYVSGGAYVLNTTNGALNKVLGSKIGLTLISSGNGNSYLFGEGGESLNTFSFNQKEGKEVSLSLKTLPEKCVSKTNSSEFICAVPSFVNNSIYPEMWYVGAVSFADNLWSVNTETGETRFIVSPSTINASIDATTLSISNDNNYLTFINKKDQTLWAIGLFEGDIKEATTTPVIN